MRKAKRNQLNNAGTLKRPTLKAILKSLKPKQRRKLHHA